MRVFHTGAEIIERPDVFYGRKNADFGQGFYLTPDRDFACLWGGEGSVVNRYELELAGLTVKRFERDADWFDYIFHNRRGRDGLDADVVIGPIANDTVFDTLGMIGSGFLKPEEALRLLEIGPVYTQMALKSPRAAAQLRFLGAEKLPEPDRERLARESGIVRHRRKEGKRLGANAYGCTDSPPGVLFTGRGRHA